MTFSAENHYLKLVSDAQVCDAHVLKQKNGIFKSELGLDIYDGREQWPAFHE
jgi:hypothetical protein